MSTSAKAATGTQSLALRVANVMATASAASPTRWNVELGSTCRRTTERARRQRGRRRRGAPLALSDVATGEPY
ncbi:hypothetical protein GCM10027446_03610 [Angustibacter peucedani]